MEWRDLAGKASYNWHRQAGPDPAARRDRQEGAGLMGRLVKAGLLLAVLAVAALTVFAYFGDYAPEPREVVVPVTLDAD